MITNTAIERLATPFDNFSIEEDMELPLKTGLTVYLKFNLNQASPNVTTSGLSRLISIKNSSSNQPIILCGYFNGTNIKFVGKNLNVHVDLFHSVRVETDKFNYEQSLTTHTFSIDSNVGIDLTTEDNDDQQHRTYSLLRGTLILEDEKISFESKIGEQLTSAINSPLGLFGLTINHKNCQLNISYTWPDREKTSDYSLTYSFLCDIHLENVLTSKDSPPEEKIIRTIGLMHFLLKLIGFTWPYTADIYLEKEIYYTKNDIDIELNRLSLTQLENRTTRRFNAGYHFTINIEDLLTFNIGITRTTNVQGIKQLTIAGNTTDTISLGFCTLTGNGQIDKGPSVLIKTSPLTFALELDFFLFDKMEQKFGSLSLAWSSDREFIDNAMVQIPGTYDVRVDLKMKWDKINAYQLIHFKINNWDFDGALNAIQLAKRIKEYQKPNTNPCIALCDFIFAETIITKFNVDFKFKQPRTDEQDKTMFPVGITGQLILEIHFPLRSKPIITFSFDITTIELLISPPETNQTIGEWFINMIKENSLLFVNQLFFEDNNLRNLGLMFAILDFTDYAKDAIAALACRRIPRVPGNFKDRFDHDINDDKPSQPPKPPPGNPNDNEWVEAVVKLAAVVGALAALADVLASLIEAIASLFQINSVKGKISAEGARKAAHRAEWGKKLNMLIDKIETSIEMSSSKSCFVRAAESSGSAAKITVNWKPPLNGPKKDKNGKNIKLKYEMNLNIDSTINFSTRHIEFEYDDIHRHAPISIIIEDIVQYYWLSNNIETQYYCIPNILGSIILVSQS
ncbi:unnamed protein product, partial [Didymodactylos carnosus]